MVENANKRRRRIGVYALLDPEGIVDRYVIDFLVAIKPYIEVINIVTTMDIDPENLSKIIQFGNVIRIRKYKAECLYLYEQGIESIGKAEIKQFDELVLFDSSVMGPVNSFEKMFEEMSGRNISIWGITETYEKKERGIVSSFFQPYFLVVKTTVSIDGVLQDNSYIDSLKDIGSDMGYQEIFGSSGNGVDCYVNTCDLKDYTDNPLLYCTQELVENRNCPVFMKKMFSWDYTDILSNSAGYRTKGFWNCLEQSNRYCTDTIWESILRTEHQEDIVRNLALTYILDEDDTTNFESEKMLKTALVMHIYYVDLIDMMLDYAKNMPRETDIYITTVTKGCEEELKRKIFEHSIPNKVTIRLIENKGRDVSSLLVGVRDVLEEYEIALFIHDKKTPQLKNGIQGNEFGRLCYDNLLFSSEYVRNVINLFSNNKRLGMLIPPFPSFGDLFILCGNEWCMDYENTLELSERLGLHVKISNDKKAIAPYGTCFWFRPEAMKKLLAVDWKYEDFPQEPNPIDGTFIHAIERIYPYVVQDAGYYTAYVMNKSAAAVEYQRLDYYLDGINCRLQRMLGLSEYNYKNIVSEIEKTLNNQQQQVCIRHCLDYRIKDLLYAILPQKVFNKTIKIKRTILGPHIEYDVNADKRYK